MLILEFTNKHTMKTVTPFTNPEKNATFTVACKSEGMKPIRTWVLAFENLKDLQEAFLRARNFWGDYIVTVDTVAFELSTSHTWNEECAQNYKD